MICLFGKQFHIPLSYLVFALLRFYIVIQFLSISHSSQVDSALLSPKNVTPPQGKYQETSHKASDSLEEYIDNSLENKTIPLLSNQQINIAHTISDLNKSSNVERHLGTNTHSVIDAKVTNKTITRHIKSKRIKFTRQNSTEQKTPATNNTVNHTIDYNAPSTITRTDTSAQTNNTATSGLQRITKGRPKTKSRPGVSLSSKNKTYLAFKNARGNKRKHTISILGLFELTESNNELRLEGLSELEAAKLAVEHVNKANMLYDYQLELHTNDTKVSPIH
ncbi:hypothetical protein M8J76_013089 [Diaphorina citri]|nr:hypothetical protein M8J75_010810 [Diaphorina citri]KAI5745647.1 hypothetical protein M8J76_013089 [Diaphorina citri]KAI5753144.1 hypothetical protein M8J77_023975 [Diaphorina citri]